MPLLVTIMLPDIQKLAGAGFCQTILNNCTCSSILTETSFKPLFSSVRENLACSPTTAHAIVVILFDPSHDKLGRHNVRELDTSETLEIPLIEDDRYFSSTQSFCLLSDKASFSQREAQFAI